MPDDLEGIRSQLVSLARRSSARIVEWKRDAPCDWRPTQVVNPESRFPFTPAGAWNFIADKLEAGQPLLTVTLRKPPDKTAYVLLVDMGAGSPRLYVKLQLGAGKIIGRSFHYSEEGQE